MKKNIELKINLRKCCKCGCANIYTGVSKDTKTGVYTGFATCMGIGCNNACTYAALSKETAIKGVNIMWNLRN